MEEQELAEAKTQQDRGQAYGQRQMLQGALWLPPSEDMCSQIIKRICVLKALSPYRYCALKQERL